MSFPLFNRSLDQFGAAPALISDADSITYAGLQKRVDQRINEWQLRVGSLRPLMLLRMANTIDSVVNYLACLQAHYPCIVVNSNARDEIVAAIVQQFSPNVLIEEGSFRLLSQQQLNLAAELAILLSTSGSTGSQQFVALSMQNLIANTRSILAFLPIENSDVTLASLPFSYSYGLSVLHTHLAMGAGVRLTDLTVMDKGFWTLLKEANIASLNGVPSWYEMLLRLRFERNVLPNLRYLTQAGGKLAEPLVVKLADYADHNNKQLFVMYGQTEATARMAYLPAHKVAAKPGSIGQALPDGQLAIINEDGEPIRSALEKGELVYQGPNVMLGYVNKHEGLASFSPSHTLHTGDIGYFDEEGDFFITGRLKRIIKLFGERCSLDEVEFALMQSGSDVRCVGKDDELVICCTSGQCDAIKQCAIQLLRVPPKSIKTYQIKEWPLLANGKTDYTALYDQLLVNA
ncbi:AMP-binding protein [Alteromonas ponticola]|uniref:AMP-binding protein n=1 Tax=Alteromonas ponticola TaxID=2720613 RepID=A0ABX1R166_9ALTE|nr:AMP-binding protein [Alteromonas ponticola]NMH59651.1 AMP-binding protein [Alteromonas ponticola]